MISSSGFGGNGYLSLALPVPDPNKGKHPLLGLFTGLLFGIIAHLGLSFSVYRSSCKTGCFLNGKAVTKSFI